MSGLKKGYWLEPGVHTVDVLLETVDRVRESFRMFQQRRL